MGARVPALLLGLVLCCGAPCAVAQDEGQVVQVNGIKNAGMHSYRSVMAGVDAFDEYRRLAPAVPELRFQLVVRRDLPAAQEATTLRIVGDDLSLPVAIDAQGQFVLPRSEAAWDTNADLILNQKKTAYRLTAVVRTPGLPANVRRLGDLRLECKVATAIGKKEIPFWVNATANMLLLTSDWCSRAKGDMSLPFPAPARLAAATLRHGERSAPLKTNNQEFTVPIGDAGWPDDSLVEMQYADR
jgi:hypothetical protein